MYFSIEGSTSYYAPTVVHVYQCVCMTSEIAIYALKNSMTRLPRKFESTHTCFLRSVYSFEFVRFVANYCSERSLRRESWSPGCLWTRLFQCIQFQISPLGYVPSLIHIICYCLGSLRSGHPTFAVSSPVTNSTQIHIGQRWLLILAELQSAFIVNAFRQY